MILKKSLSSVRMSTWLKLTGVLALIVGLAIFTGAAGSSLVQGQKYTFHMVVYRGIAHPEAWADLSRGAKEVDEVHPDLEVIYSETDDFREFVALVERAIAAKPDGLIVTLNGFLRVMGMVMSGATKIPIIAIGAIPESYRYFCERYPEVSCIGEDPYQAGVMAAEESLKRFTPRAAFVVFDPQDDITELRMNGFLSAIRGAEVPVEVEVIPEMNIDLLLARLREFRGQETLVFITAPLSFTERFIQLAKEFKIELGPGGVRIVQAGVSPKALEYIEKDKIMLAAIDQQWYLQGHLSVEGMYSYVKYGMRRPWVATQEVVTEDTIKTARELGAPLDDPLGLLLAEAKGQPIRVVSNPCLCLPNPSFEISDATKKDELAKYFKDLPKATPPARALCGGFGIFNPALDRRLPFSYAHVASGVIKVPERVGKKIEYVYYKDKHGLEKWLKELQKKLSLNELREPEDPLVKLLLAAMKKWAQKKWPIRVRRDIGSSPESYLPSIWFSDPAKVEELAKFFEDLPKTTKPAWAESYSGGFMLLPDDGRMLWWVTVDSGVIEIRMEVIKKGIGREPVHAYYKDIHGLERWLEELYERSTGFNQLIAAMEKLPIQVSLNPYSSLPNPSFWITDPAKIDELAKLLEGLPKINKPYGFGRFAIWGNPMLDPRIPLRVLVGSGVIKILEGSKEGEPVYGYYKDIHGLEKWLGELYKQESIEFMEWEDQSSAPISAERTSSPHEPESTSLPAQQLPTTGAEPPYNDELWNELPYSPIELGRYLEGKATIDDRWVLAKHWALEVIQRKNNCYNYADNIVTDTLAQPGRLRGVVIPEAYWVEDGKKIDGSPGDHTLAELCKKLEEATKADGLTVIDCAKVCPPSKPGGKPDSYKEMLFVGNYDAPTGADRDGDRATDRKWRDYHFYRQDKGGRWSHKPGRTEVTNRDASGNPITDPRRADRKYEGLEYTEFCGCFCRGPGVAKK